MCFLGIKLIDSQLCLINWFDCRNQINHFQMRHDLRDNLLIFRLWGKRVSNEFFFLLKTIRAI